jgi:Glycosyltransferase family 87
VGRGYAHPGDIHPRRHRASRTRLRRVRTIAGWSALAVGVHAAILLAPLLGVGLYGQLGAAALHDDRLYFDYASRALAGAVPYRDYPVEYPPLAIPLFVVPRLATHQFGAYAFIFAGEMLLFDSLALYLVARRTAAREGPREVPARLAWYTAFFAALYPVVGSRYDLAPAAVAFAGALTWFGGRPVAGGLLTAAGALLKIFPAVVAAPAAVFELVCARATRCRGLLTFAVVTVAGGVAWYALGGAASLIYHVERGLQIETLGAGALMLVDKIAGVAPAWRYSHTSVELVAPLAEVFAVLAIPAQCVMLAAVVWRFRRSGMQDPLSWAAAAILAFILPGKVLSPQYLIWLLPFIPAISGRAGHRVRTFFLLACAATALEYLAIRHVTAFEFWAILILNVRNALLVVLLVVLLSGGNAGVPVRSISSRR